MSSIGEVGLGRLEPAELPARTLTAVPPVTRPELSVIVLCYQANEAIHRVIDPLYEQLEASGVAYELLLVANQWADRPDPTGEVVEAFAHGPRRHGSHGDRGEAGRDGLGHAQRPRGRRRATTWS